MSELHVVVHGAVVRGVRCAVDTPGSWVICEQGGELWGGYNEGYPALIHR